MARVRTASADEIARASIRLNVSPLTRFVDALFRNRVHLIVCAAVSVWAWPNFLGFKVVPVDFLVVPAIVLCVYQWNRLTDRREDSVNCPADLEHALQHRLGILCACCAALLGVAVSMIATGNRFSNLLLALILGLGFAYSTPTRWRLKSLFVVKNASSATGWSLLTLVYPAAHAHAAIDRTILFAAAAMLVGVFSCELIWDVRDRLGDAAAGVDSLPVRYGIAPVITTLVLVNAAYLALVIVAVSEGMIAPRWLYTATSALICLAAAPWSSRFGDRRFTHGLVVGLTLLLCGLGFLRGR